MDYFVLACEIMFVIFTVYYTVEEIIEVKMKEYSPSNELSNNFRLNILNCNISKLFGTFSTF